MPPAICARTAPRPDQLIFSRLAPRELIASDSTRKAAFAGLERTPPPGRHARVGGERAPGLRFSRRRSSAPWCRQIKGMPHDEVFELPLLFSSCFFFFLSLFEFFPSAHRLSVLPQLRGSGRSHLTALTQRARFRGSPRSSETEGPFLASVSRGAFTATAILGRAVLLECEVRIFGSSAQGYSYAPAPRS